MVPYVTDTQAADTGRSRHGKLLQHSEITVKQTVSANMEASVPLTMYTTTWCGFCKNLKRQLSKAGVEMNEVDIELDPEAAKFVQSVNGGNQTVPTLLFADGSTMCNPSAAQVQKKLAELAATTAS
jgi:mycoredoxin